MNEIVNECYREATKSIRKHITPRGLNAAIAGYTPYLHARDVMISGMGCLLAGEEDIKIAFRKSLEIVSRFQKDTGQIPTTVRIEEKKPFAEFLNEDVNQWYILGHYFYFQTTRDKDFLLKHFPSIEKTIFWLRCQDVDNCNLLETREGGNWMDFFPQQHNVLFDNVLWYAALIAASRMAEACNKKEISKRYKTASKDIRKKINLVFWIDRDAPLKDYSIFKDCSRKLWRYQRVIGDIGFKTFYLPFLSFSDAADYFDTFGNLLAILTSVTDGEKSFRGEKADLILNYIRDVGVDKPYPVKSIHPPVSPGDKWWRDYLRQGILPYQYTNGAIWPFIGGFYVAALVKCGRIKEAEKQLEQLALTNKLGCKHIWEFNEFLHGLTGNPMGPHHMLWNAAMYVYAYHVVKNGKVIYFEGEI